MRQRKAQNKTFDLIITALLIALIYVSTVFINIPLPGAKGGLMHLGTTMLFIIGFLFGPRKAAVAGAIGMGIFDLLGGWAIWAPITIVARGLQGYIVGKIAWSAGRNGNHIGMNITAAVVSIPFMVAVYYIGEGILYANWIAPLASIPGDLIQSIVGILIAVPAAIALKKIPCFKNL